eukprot:141784_1
MVQCNASQWIATVFTILITAFLWIFTVFILYKYIVYKKSSIIQQPNFLYYPGLIFIILISLSLFSYIFVATFLCINDTTRLLIETIFSLFYGLQFYLLLLIMFLRLYYVFHNSPLKLSKITTYSYILIYILLPILIIFTLSLGLNHTLFVTFVTISFVLFVILILSIIILFIAKLVRVYKYCANDEELMDAVTKTTILTLVSILVTLLIPTHSLLREPFDFEYGSWFYFLGNVFTILDIFTNFLCIVMSYKYFDSYYYYICGCLDTQCKSLCSLCFGIHMSTKDVEMMEKNSYGSKITIDSDTCTSPTTQI